MPEYVRYSCDCLTGAQHVHEVVTAEARRRGQYEGLAAACVSGSSTVADAVCGAATGALIGDALASPWHWVYTHSELLRLRATHGDVVGYRSWPAGELHADAAAYFKRCNPAAQPTDIFNGYAALWAVPGTPYHGTLPAGDNTLTGRLVSRLLHCVVRDRGLRAESWVRDYTTLLTEGAAAGQCARDSAQGHNDTWIDETHRVFAANTARGAASYASGMADCCLTGLALSLPLLLAYHGNRDAQEAAVRVCTQFTHKSEDMVRDIMCLADLVNNLLSPHYNNRMTEPADGGGDGGGGDAAVTGDKSVLQLLATVFAATSVTPMSLHEVLSRNLSDEAAYFGAPGVAPLFSKR